MSKKYCALWVGQDVFKDFSRVVTREGQTKIYILESLLKQYVEEKDVEKEVEENNDGSISI